jgi:hypothetical protein
MKSWFSVAHDILNEEKGVVAFPVSTVWAVSVGVSSNDPES